MRMVRNWTWLIAATALAAYGVIGASACSSSSDEGAGGDGGSAGEAGAAGQAGAAGNAGAAGQAGGAGQAGAAGQAGGAGEAGAAGVGGGAGNAGAAGEGGAGAGGGTGGTGGDPNTCAVPNPGNDSQVHSCGSLGAAPSSGTCTVSTPSSPNGSRVFRGVVLGPDDVYDGGEVLVDSSGVIQCVGCSCSSESSYAQAVKITCPEGVISPGLINAHDHITYGNNPPYGTTGPSVANVRYDHRHEWRPNGPNVGKPKINTASGANQNVQSGVELRFMMSGATSINGSNGASGILRNLDKPDKLDGLPIKELKYDTFPLGDSSGPMLNSGCGYPSPVTTSEAQGYSFYTPHVSEGINQAARNEFTCLSQDGHDALFPRAAWIHSVGLKAEDVKLFSREGTKIIWSPRTNVSLYGDTARAPLFHKAGAIIALGTDWIASGSMSMVREFKCVRDLNETAYNSFFSDEDIWRMATTNGAFATGTQQVLGMLRKGYVADVAIYNGHTNKLHAAVTKAGLSDVVLVTRGSLPMYGDSSLMTSLGKGSCEDMPAAADASSNPAWATGVCGVAKKACVADDPDAGTTTLSSIVSSLASIYPLYFCGTPTNEPSCVPMRPNEYTGVPTADDSDGDGVANASDNCPNVFNAIRPMDGNAQPDYDGDGQGDECDPCPFDADNSHCTYNWDANDIDCDGIKNGSDNCPQAANNDQADNDHDGKGNACDSCPDTANPGYQACPAVAATIEQVRSPSVPPNFALGDQVTLSGVVVIGVRGLTSGSSRGFYLSDETQGPWHCIFVHTGSTTPTVSVGDRINIAGTLAEYDGTSQIANGATITVTASGAALPETQVTVADLIGTNAEAWESCRVKVLDVTGVAGTGTNINIQQGSDQIWASNFIWKGTGSFVSAGTHYTEIRGFAGVHTDVRQLLPQVDADLVP